MKPQAANQTLAVVVEKSTSNVKRQTTNVKCQVSDSPPYPFSPRVSVSLRLRVPGSPRPRGWVHAAGADDCDFNHHNSGGDRTAAVSKDNHACARDGAARRFVQTAISAGPIRRRQREVTAVA